MKKFKFSFFPFSFFLLSLILIFSCSEKPTYKNPFDPGVDPNDWAPSNLQLEKLSNTSVQLTWEDNSDGEDGFIMERKVNDENWIQLIQVNENVTYYTDNTVNNEVPFAYRVIAYAGENISAYSNEIFFNKIPKDGLVAEYLFTNGNTDDTSGNGNHGQNNGATATLDRFGNEISAFYFDGNDDYIDCENDISLNFNESFSVSLWVNPSLLNQYQRLIGKGYVPDADISNWSITLENNNRIAFFWESSDDEDHLIYTNSIMSQTLFYHITVYVDIDSEEYCIFIDGNLNSIQNTDGDIPASNSNPLNIGVSQTQTSFDRYFNGVIDDIRIYNRALTESEIQALYNEGGWDTD